MTQTASLARTSWVSIVDKLAATKAEISGLVKLLINAKPEQLHTIAAEIRQKVALLDLATLQRRIVVKLDVVELFKTDPESLSQFWLERCFDLAIINRLFARADSIVYNLEKHPPREAAGLLFALEFTALIICNYDNADEDPTACFEEEPRSLEELASKCRLLSFRRQAVLNMALRYEDCHLGDHHAYQHLLGTIESTSDLTGWPNDVYPWLKQDVSGTEEHKEANYVANVIHVNWQQLGIPEAAILLASQRHFSRHLHMALHYVRGLDQQLANMLM